MSAGWVHDLCQELGILTLVCSTHEDAWRWRNVKRKTDKDDAIKLAQILESGCERTRGDFLPAELSIRSLNVMPLAGSRYRFKNRCYPCWPRLRGRANTLLVAWKRRRLLADVKTVQAVMRHSQFVLHWIRGHLIKGAEQSAVLRMQSADQIQCERVRSLVELCRPESFENQ